MFDLLQAYPGNPSTGLHHLRLAHQTLLFYPSVDGIVILNAQSLALVRVLAFWEAFPGTFYTKDTVNCISVDSSMKIIVASMSSRIAAWSLSGVQNDTWRIHSSLLLPEDHIITTLDIKYGLLAVGSQNGLSVYNLVLDNDLPTWSQKWLVNVTTPSLIRFSPSLMYIATTSQNDHDVRLYSTTSGLQTQEIHHPRPVINITWRQSQASSRDDLILYTITSDSTLRIFFPVLDSPRHLQLHASLDLFSSVPSSTTSESFHESSVFWLDRDTLDGVLANTLKHVQQEDARSKRVQEIKDEGWDLFLRVVGDGSVVVSAVANIDSRPPTLLRQFMLQQSPPSVLRFPPSYLCILPTPDQSSVTLVTSPPLASFDLAPLAFFDGQPDGLCIRAQWIKRVPEEESKVVRLVRTPDGKGVGVIRSDGGEVWRVAEKGSSLVRAGTWPVADRVVILDGGKMFATYSVSDSILTLHATSPATLPLPPIESLFSLPSNGSYESILGITAELSVVHVLVSDQLTLTLYSYTALSLPSPPNMIIPVDPMGWSGSNYWSEQAVLLSVSEQGELAFWATEIGSKPGWRCTGKVNTGRTGLRMATCSSARKSALVVPGSDGEELTIWDSKKSEFASGLEFRKVFSSSEPIHDLDWSSTPDGQSILAVGFSHHVEVLSQHRMTYFDEGPGWSVCWTVNIGNIVPYHITDSIWLANGSLLIAAGHQMYLFGQPSNPLSDKDYSNTLFEYVAQQNGSLVDYHPQMLLQCLLWEKVELVKEIIVNLAHDVKSNNFGRKSGNRVPLEHFLGNDQEIQPYNVQHNRHYTNLFDGPEQNNTPGEEGFSRALVLDLIEALELHHIPHLTPNEQAHLLVLIQTTLEINEQRRSLDANGLRYLISMRSFYILNHRTSAPSSPQSNGVIPRRSGRRERLRYRDMIWAFHSESQDILLNASIAACNGKMCWSDARALGISVWLNSLEALKSHMEVIARNEYMAGDKRDPVACSLYYFALGKVKLVHGLWRQAVWHKEQPVMLKFLSNDFTEPRWRTAALKNAYALLSKQRFEYAAAFFLLGGSLKDAVNVCIKQLSDFQLAVALARVVEQSNDGPILCDILKNVVLPIAFHDGNRWLGSWAFWILRRRDLAVRILLTPLRDIANALDVQVTEIGDSHYDDPSLALLFSQLRSKTLQTAQGTSEISGRAEFNFVLQIARVFCRMGCHVLALDLVQSWSFERPSSVVLDLTQSSPPSPTIPRRSTLRRRSSIVIDIDIPAFPPTRPASPTQMLEKIPEQETMQEEGDLLARKAGLGSLMKSAKLDIRVPEFDMSAFI